MKSFSQLTGSQLFTGAFLSFLSILFISCRKDLIAEQQTDMGAERSVASSIVQPPSTPYRPDQAIIVYPAHTSEARRKEIRDKWFPNLNFQVVPCICDANIETLKGQGLDKIVDSLINKLPGPGAGPGSQLSPTSTNLGVNAQEGNNIILSKNLLLQIPAVKTTTTITTTTNKIVPLRYAAPRGKVRVAVIDTGLDTLNYFTASSYANFLMPATAANYRLAGIKGPSLMNRSRYFGWNFLQNNQNIMDDNTGLKQGTNVTGLILQQSQNVAPEIIPLKAFDAAGRAALSDVLCALRFAELAQAKIINAAWSYSGKTNLALKEIIRRLAVNNILMVTAAGNNGWDITFNTQFPACFSKDIAGLKNTITVATATSAGVCSFNNYSKIHVDAGVSGPDNNCTMLSPFNGSTGLPGSSFAAAVMTGTIARHYESISWGVPLKEHVLITVLPQGMSEAALTNQIRTGKRIRQIKIPTTKTSTFIR